MLQIRAFQSLRPADELVSQVACVPYDVLDSAEAAVLAENNPFSLLHVDRAEIDCPPGTDIHSDEVYAKAVENFLRLQKEGTLQREPVPCIYIYELTMGKHVQTGIAAVCHVDDYENNLIKKHEKTRKDKEDDRTRLVGDLSANTGPIFLTYRDQPRLDALVEAGCKKTPLYHFTAPDGIIHKVWRIEGGEDFIQAFQAVPCSYVADGHHRTASAVRVGKERKAANPHHTGKEDYNWFLSVIFPASQLKILPYNRVVNDLNGRTPKELLQAMREKFSIEETTQDTPDAPGKVSIYLEGKWYAMQLVARPDADPVSRLDVSVLQDEILAPLLGIDDPRTSQRIEFIGGIRGTAELVNRVDTGRSAIAFSMFPTTVDQLMDIADAGQIMPPKSTWFEPKLRSGLFIHTF